MESSDSAAYVGEGPDAPNHAARHFEYGRELMTRNRLDKACVEFRAALCVEPDHAHAHALLACCLHDLGDLPQALIEAETALQLAPASPLALCAVGLVYQSLGRIKEAKQYFDKALQIDPYMLWGRQLRVGHLRSNAKYSAALEECELALGMYPTDANLLNTRGLLLGDLGRHAESKAAFVALLSQEPEDPYGQTNLGHIYLRAGEFEKAAACFQGALRVAPSIEAARLGILETMKASNRFYRGMLRLQAGWNRATPIKRLGIVVLAYLVVSALGVSTARFHFTPSIAVVYLFWVPMIFLGTWKYLGNLLLLSHPVGRWALTEAERRTSIFTAAMLGMLTPVGILIFFTIENGKDDLPPWLGLYLALIMFVVIPVGAMLRVVDGARRRRAFAVYAFLWPSLFLIIALADSYSYPALSLLTLLLWGAAVLYWVKLVFRA